MSRPPWYRSWFGDDYLALYPHRGRAEAAEAVELLRRALGRDHGERVLDLACGAGRHLVELEKEGFRSYGLDLSATLLRRAREEGVRASLVRGDMRTLPFGSAVFDVVTNFFTSFGYFRDPADDRVVLAEIRRVLRDGGHVLLDFLNAPQVRSTLRPVDQREVDGVSVRQERRLVIEEEGVDMVEKTITIRPGEPGERRFVERVRLYEADHLRRLLRDVGLEPLDLFGDYAGAPFGPETPRCILTGRAS